MTNFLWKLVFQPLSGRVYVNLPEGMLTFTRGYMELDKVAIGHRYPSDP